jgi:hypothetical protein
VIYEVELHDDKWWNVIYEYAHMEDNSLFTMQIQAISRETAIEDADRSLISYVLLPNNWQFVDCQETQL